MLGIVLEASLTRSQEQLHAFRLRLLGFIEMNHQCKQMEMEQHVKTYKTSTKFCMTYIMGC